MNEDLLSRIENIAVVDQKRIESLNKIEPDENNNSLLKKLTHLYTKQCKELSPKIKTSFEADSFDNLRKYCHKLRGSSRYLGLLRCEQVFAELEIATDNKMKIYKEEHLLEFVLKVVEEAMTELKKQSGLQSL